MKLLINDKEIAYFLISLLDLKKDLLNIPVPEIKTSELIGSILLRKEKEGMIRPKFYKKIKDKVRLAVRDDLESWRRQVLLEIREKKKFLERNLHNDIDFFVKKFLTAFPGIKLK